MSRCSYRAMILRQQLRLIIVYCVLKLAFRMLIASSSDLCDTKIPNVYGNVYWKQSFSTTSSFATFAVVKLYRNNLWIFWFQTFCWLFIVFFFLAYIPWCFLTVWLNQNNCSYVLCTRHLGLMFYVTKFFYSHKLLVKL